VFNQQVVATTGPQRHHDRNRSVVYGQTAGLLAVVTMLLPTVPAQALELGPTSGGRHQPMDSLQVLLTGEKPQQLLFELDGLDVTALARFHPGQAVLHPSQQLATGGHHLTVYRLVGETLHKLRDLPFQVTAAPGFALANVDIQATLNVSYPALRQGPAHAQAQTGWQSDGAANINGKWGHRDWEVGANANVFFDTLRGRSSGFSGGGEQSVADLGDFLIQAKKGNLSGKIGHHDVGEQGLVLHSFHRRGISIGWQTRNKRYGATGFAFSSEPVSGFRHGLGVGSKRTRVTGTTATLKPFAAGAEATTVNLTWIDGQTQGLRTSSIVQDNRIKGGNAVGLEATRGFFHNRLKLRGEWAGSHYDFAGQQSGQSATPDDARVIAVKYQPIVADYANHQSQSLELGLDQRHIGTFFRSLANPGLPADLDSSRGYAQYSNHGAVLQVTVEKQNNNSGDSPLLATIETLLKSVTASYSPLYLDGGKPGFLGRPSFGASWSESTQKSQYTPPNYPLKLDTSTTQTTLFSSFSHTRWDWTINLSRGEISDALGTVAGSKNTLLGLGLNLRPGRATQLGGQWQYSRQTSDLGAATDQYLVNLNLSTELIPKKLAANGRFSWNEQKSDAVVQSRSATMDLGLSWIALAARPKRAGLTLWLRGQYNQQHSSQATTTPGNSYQALLGLTMKYQK